jgi:hypothetical protein
MRATRLDRYPSRGKYHHKAKSYAVDLRRPYPLETPHPKDCDLPARFVSKIEVDATTGCWLWTAARALDGGGRFGNNGGKKATPLVVNANRFAFEQVIGRLPKRLGLHLDHLCRNRQCCNPWHMEPVTHAENIRRGLASNREDGLCRAGLHEWNEENILHEPNGVRRCRPCRDAREKQYRPPKGNSPQDRTHCPRGHAYEGDNLGVNRNGHRFCRTCHRARELDRYHRLKQTETTNGAVRRNFQDNRSEV